MPRREATSSSPRQWSSAGSTSCRSSPSFSPNGPRSMSGLCSPTAISTSSRITSTLRYASARSWMARWLRRGRRGAQRGVRQPRLFRRARRPEKAGRPVGAGRGDVRSVLAGAALDLPRPEVEARKARGRPLRALRSTTRRRRSTGPRPASASRVSSPIGWRRRSLTAEFRLSLASMSRRPRRSASSIALRD